MSDENAKPKIPVLTANSYHEWMATVADELYAIEAEALIAKSALNTNGTEQNGNVADDVVLPATRRQAYIIIKRSISEEIKRKLQDTVPSEVEALLGGGSCFTLR